MNNSSSFIIISFNVHKSYWFLENFSCVGLQKKLSLLLVFMQILEFLSWNLLQCLFQLDLGLLSGQKYVILELNVEVKRVIKRNIYFYREQLVFGDIIPQFVSYEATPLAEKIIAFPHNTQNLNQSIQLQPKFLSQPHLQFHLLIFILLQNDHLLPPLHIPLIIVNPICHFLVHIPRSPLISCRRILQF